ncbi:hypothetical protein BFP97_13670 [Roseivirga sp. 4D4]|uniref:hypothetical protein n=1 Tax=Roseivirga sp. 4D4 TaxID=1889784 RepID=UPI0008534916|nr:hypothetical protein [Roseivirga sp. 4D4]OEK02506.1 hypothetical protein BFP97_13670 [Roseivirga sp. 4D4]
MKEFSFESVLFLLIKKKKQLAVVLIVSVFVGIAFAYIKKPVFSSASILIPNQESKSGVSSNISGIASLAGINVGSMNGTQGGISPVLFNKVVASPTFGLKVLNQRIPSLSTDSTVTFKDYYLNISKPDILNRSKSFVFSIPGEIISLFKEEKVDDETAEIIKVEPYSTAIIELSKEDRKALKSLNSSIFVSLNEQDGFVTVSTIADKAKITAELNKTVLDALLSDLKVYVTKKEREELVFLDSLRTEAYEEFVRLKEKLAKWQDENLGLSTESSKTELEFIREEYDLKYNVYKNILNEYEKQRIAVQKETPAISVISPPTVPKSKSAPNRFIILFITVLLIVGGYIFILVLKPIIKIYWSKLKSYDS